MSTRRNKAQQLRATVRMLPRHTREAMLEGIRTNRIVVGAYTLQDDGICPMLAAHRNGGRTDFASFARAWDEFTGARRARRATRREVRVLRSYLEMSLIDDELPADSLVTLAEDIRAARRAAEGPPPEPPRTLRIRRRPRVDVIEATLAAAEAQADGGSDAKVLDKREDPEHPARA